MGGEWEQGPFALAWMARECGILDKNVVELHLTLSPGDSSPLVRHCSLTPHPPPSLGLYTVYYPYLYKPCFLCSALLYASVLLHKDLLRRSFYCLQWKSSRMWAEFWEEDGVRILLKCLPEILTQEFLVVQQDSVLSLLRARGSSPGRGTKIRHDAAKLKRKNYWVSLYSPPFPTGKKISSVESWGQGCMGCADLCKSIIKIKIHKAASTAPPLGFGPVASGH